MKPPTKMKEPQASSKADRSAGINIPIIVYSSANHAGRNRREVLQAGGNGVTASPLELLELVDKARGASN